VDVSASWLAASPVSLLVMVRVATSGVKRVETAVFLFPKAPEHKIEATTPP